MTSTAGMLAVSRISPEPWHVKHDAWKRRDRTQSRVRGATFWQSGQSLVLSVCTLHQHVLGRTSLQCGVSTVQFERLICKAERSCSVADQSSVLQLWPRGPRQQTSGWRGPAKSCCALVAARKCCASE